MVTLYCGRFLARGGYESAAHGQALELDMSALLLEKNGKLPTERHFIYYNNLVSSDQAVKCFDDTEIQDAGADDFILSFDLDIVDVNVVQIVIILSIHEAIIKGQSIRHLNRPYLRFCDGLRELYRFEPATAGNARTLEFCRILRNGTGWVLVTTGIGSQNDLADYVLSHLPANS